MPETEKVFDRTLKEWSLVILVVNLGIVMALFTWAAGTAIANPESNIVITGEIDLGQFTAIIIGVAIVAVTLVAQQMTARQTITTMKETDEAWKDNP